MDAVDTNVLIYAHDPREPGKQARAANLIEALDDGVLLWQVACEYLSASRKLEPLGYSREQAWQDMEDLRRVWTTILPSWNVLNTARGLLDRYGLSFWDSMIVAACLGGGVSQLHTENFGGHSDIDGVKIVNPFH